MFVGAYVIIVLLSWILVGMNVLAVVDQFSKDGNKIRLFSYLATLLLLGSMMIGVSSIVVQRVIDSETFLKSDASPSLIHYYRR